MVEEQLVNRRIKDLRILEAMGRVPRHLFVAEALRHKAYGDHPLPIGENQTISQPYMVGLMTQALRLNERDKVMEIGTGCGYQTAILAELAEQVFTIERIKPLSQEAEKCLGRLDYQNVVYRICDGTYGWRDQAPYDAILIAAAMPQIPKSFIGQLKDRGRLVAPVGPTPDRQRLTLLTKNGENITTRSIADCKFVPLIGKYGWPETLEEG
ncbi:MAG: protein-L-isoaspartate(D-aspartate) O-methyltransferase [Nitrospinota bacterium]|nr:protein-L-isoaspartate(D-aspartate) O-methyltransferase [Nitrospinota bacterium]